MPGSTHETLPTTSSTISGWQTFLEQEDQDRTAETSGGWIFSGGLHATAGTRTSSAFATTGYTADGAYVAQSAAAVDYAARGAATSDTCWLILNSATTGDLGNFSRQPGTHYLADCTSSTQPTLPAASAWLAKITIAASAITVVTDLRAPSSYASAGVFNVRDPLYGTVGDGVTNDGAALALAIAAGLAQGQPLYFPAGTYLTTASLASLHTLVKTGPGVLARGSDLFYLSPTSTQSNILYVATGGSDANDGLTSSQPVATLAQALTILKSYGPALNGTWTIKLAAGTYSQGTIDFPVILGNLNRVTIQGVVVNHPNVPTTIFDGGSSLAYGLTFNSRAYATVSNIKFQNYVTYGVVAQDLADITCVNVHCATIPNGPGIKIQQGRLRVEGGILTACQQGVVAISNATFTVGDPAVASTVNGTQMTNCTQAGMLVQESATGHADYCTITNCAVGLDIVERSRVHAQACAITNNATAGVRYRDNSSWLDNGTSANFSGNTHNELGYSFSMEVNRDASRTSEVRQAMDQTLITRTGVEGTTVVKTYTGAIAADSFKVETKAFRIKIYGTLTGTVGTKNVTVNLAASAAFGFTTGAVAGDFVFDGIIYPHGTSGAQQSYVASLQITGQTCAVQQGSRSITMITGSAIDVTIQTVVNGAADTLVIRAVDLYCIGGC